MYKLGNHNYVFIVFVNVPYRQQSFKPQNLPSLENIFMKILGLKRGTMWR